MDEEQQDIPRAEKTSVDARLSVIEASMQKLQHAFMVFSSQKQQPGVGSITMPCTASKPNFSDSSATLHAPPFVAVSSAADASGMSNQDGFPTFPVLSQTSGLESAIPGVPREWLGLNSQLLLSAQPSEPNMTVSGVIPPVPGYLVSTIKKNIFVDLTLLRPCNLDKLPDVEPVGPQLTRLLKCDRKSSELQAISSFRDWAEAWAVYAGVVFQCHPEKISDLVAYFLFIAKTSRDSQNLGWLDYEC